MSFYLFWTPSEPELPTDPAVPRSNFRYSTSLLKKLKVYQSDRIYYKAPNQLGTESAVIVILCRNSELDQLQKTIKSFEKAFNKRFRYPYLFINDQPFTDEFKTSIARNTKADVEFTQTVPGSWGYPSWINQTYAKETRDVLEEKNVDYGGSESYRFMCRYFSGYFFRHPSVSKYEYYWRVEPGVKFSCSIDEDPFRYMKEHNKLYGYKIMIHEYMETVPTLWESTREWMRMVGVQDAPLFDFFRNETGQYNGCHFWSNFEIAKVEMWNNPVYLSYFNYLDNNGGFFYERYASNT
jgi:alpha 1,2-mannosyltransferase